MQIQIIKNAASKAIPILFEKFRKARQAEKTIYGITKV